MKHIIREVAPEYADFRDFFDDDGLTEKGGDYCYNLFIVCNDRGRVYGFNIDEYKRVMDQAENVLDGFSDIDEKDTSYYANYKEVMIYNQLDYTPRRCHALREWAQTADAGDAESIAAFLTITTGKRWAVQGVSGYCQGDYCEVVYCVEHYENARIYGEVWLGCAKEFCVIDLEDDGTEGDACYGFIVADCQAWQDEDYKKLVCEWAEISMDETRLEMIDGSQTYTKYSYRAC